MNNEIKILKFNENNTFIDENSLTHSMPEFKSNPFRGRVVMKDDEGNIILEKDNMIVLRGRTFALEKLFNDPVNNTDFSGLTPNYVANLDRKICFFKIGTGGISGGLFNVVSPTALDRDLSNSTPFVTISSNSTLTSNPSLYPSVISAMPTLGTDELYKYQLGISSTKPGVIGIDASAKDYYGKTFDSKPAWYFNSGTNEVYKKITCTIATTDARNESINELGLFFATIDSTNPYTVKDVEMFSRITFESEPLFNQTKQIKVEYFIYA